MKIYLLKLCWIKIYRKAALKLVQDLGEDAFPELKQAAAALDDASSRTAAADSAAPESTTAPSASSEPVVESSKESTPFFGD